MVEINRILENFLKHQHEETMPLAAESDLVEIFPDPEDIPQRYVIRCNCRSLVRLGNGEIGESDGPFEVGVRFPRDYLRKASPPEILTWRTPANIFHPNIRAPFICVGHLSPGTPLLDLVYQVYEVVSFQNVTMCEEDALNKEACAWARRNTHRFPVDDRPLKRRAVNLSVRVTEQSPSED